MDEVIGFRLLCLVQSNNLKYKALSTAVVQTRHPAVQVVGLGYLNAHLHTYFAEAQH